MVGFDGGGASSDGKPAGRALVVMGAIGQLALRAVDPTGATRIGVALEVDIAESLVPSSEEWRGRSLRTHYPVRVRSASNPVLVGVPRGVRLTVRAHGVTHGWVDGDTLRGEPSDGAEPLRVPRGATAPLELVIEESRADGPGRGPVGVLEIAGSISMDWSAPGQPFAFLDPIAEGAASCPPRWAPVDGDGSFRFDRLPEGMYRVTAFHPRMVRVSAPPVAAGTANVTLRLRDPRPTSIELNLVAGGRGVDRWVVEVWDVPPGASLEPFTASTPLEPERLPRAPLRLDVPRITPDLPGPLTFASTRRGRGASVELHLERASASIGVFAWTEDGAPVGADGTYTLERVPPGAWSVALGTLTELMGGGARSVVPVKVAPGAAVTVGSPEAGDPEEWTSRRR